MYVCLCHSYNAVCLVKIHVALLVRVWAPVLVLPWDFLLLVQVQQIGLCTQKLLQFLEKHNIVEIISLVVGLVLSGIVVHFFMKIDVSNRMKILFK